MEQLGPIVIAALFLGTIPGFVVGRLTRRMMHRADVPVVEMKALREGDGPQLTGTVGLTVAVPQGILRRTRIGDTVSVFLR